MRLTESLLGWLPSFFDKTPLPFPAMRVRFDGPGVGNVGPFGCRWAIADGSITVTRTEEGSPDITVTEPLAGHTIAGLAQFLAGHGFAITLTASPAEGVISALALMDGSGDQATSNGDLISAYTSLLWAYLEPVALELQRAEEQIERMLLQLSTRTASGEWLDFLGSFYAVPRLDGESDTAYSGRIIAEVLRPRGNGLAMAMAIKDATGQDVTVTDVTIYGEPVPNYGGSYIHDGSQIHSATNEPIYGLFDVVVGYDLINGGPPDAFADAVRALIGRLRDAGTHLRSLLLSGSQLSDQAPMPASDPMSGLALAQTLSDTGPLPDDAALQAGPVLSLGTDTLPPGDDSAQVFAATQTLDDTGPLPNDAASIFAPALSLGLDDAPLPGDAALAATGTLALGNDALPPPTDPTALDTVELTYGERLLDGTYLLDGTWYLASGTTAVVHIDGST